MPPGTSTIGFLGSLHLLLFGIFVPYAAWRTKNRIQFAMPSFRAHARGTIINLLVMGGFSVFVARREWIDLFPRRVPSLVSIATGALLLIFMVLAMRPRWRRAVEKRTPIVQLFMPADARERVSWFAIATLAGAFEEITWRGVQYTLLLRLTHNAPLAAAICCVSFALGHAVQGWRSVVAILGFAASFHLLVWIAGSLYVAMVAHCLYDAIAGLTYGKLGRELGYTPLEPAPATQP